MLLACAQTVYSLGNPYLDGNYFLLLPSSLEPPTGQGKLNSYGAATALVANIQLIVVTKDALFAEGDAPWG